jgi:hypothetical protein
MIVGINHINISVSDLGIDAFKSHPVTIMEIEL